jgi:hypothetical protein
LAEQPDGLAVSFLAWPRTRRPGHELSQVRLGLLAWHLALLTLAAA